MLTEAKTIGSKLFGGRLTPQMQPVDKAACGKAAFGIPEAETRFLRTFRHIRIHFPAGGIHSCACSDTYPAGPRAFRFFLHLDL